VLILSSAAQPEKHQKQELFRQVLRPKIAKKHLKIGFLSLPLACSGSLFQKWNNNRISSE